VPYNPQEERREKREERRKKREERRENREERREEKDVQEGLTIIQKRMMMTNDISGDGVNDLNDVSGGVSGIVAESNRTVLTRKERKKLKKKNKRREQRVKRAIERDTKVRVSHEGDSRQSLWSVQHENKTDSEILSETTLEERQEREELEKQRLQWEANEKLFEEQIRIRREREEQERKAKEEKRRLREEKRKQRRLTSIVNDDSDNTIEERTTTTTDAGDHSHDKNKELECEPSDRNSDDSSIKKSLFSDQRDDIEASPLLTSTIGWRNPTREEAEGGVGFVFRTLSDGGLIMVDAAGAAEPQERLDTKEKCNFYLKTGICRFGYACSRLHPSYPSSTTLLFKNMYPLTSSSSSSSSLLLSRKPLQNVFLDHDLLIEQEPDVSVFVFNSVSLFSSPFFSPHTGKYFSSLDPNTTIELSFSLHISLILSFLIFLFPYVCLLTYSPPTGGD